MDKRLKFTELQTPADPVAIKATRLAAGLSITAAARICGFKTTSWKKWESGRSLMPDLVWTLFNTLTTGTK